jgi:hypothetical protein
VVFCNVTYTYVTLELLGSAFPIAAGAPVLVGLFILFNLFFMLWGVLTNVILVS